MELTQLLQGSASVSTALLFGAMAFFSFLMAPLIFIKLEAEIAGKFVRAVFPWYYLTLICLSSISCLLLITIAPLNAGLLALVASSALYCRQILMPSINNFRDQAKSGDIKSNQSFERLHKRSEFLNYLQLIAVLAVMLHLSFVNFS